MLDRPTMIKLMGAVAATMALAALSPGWVEGQQPQVTAATMSLEEAITLARRYNPQFRVQENDEGDADWQVREAYASFLPDLTVQSFNQYQAEGTPSLGIVDVGLQRSPQTYFSQYSITTGISLSGSTFFQAAQARANARAVSTRVNAAEYTLLTDVTRQYLAALRAQHAVALNQQELENAVAAHELATARFEAGASTRLDVSQSEVLRGRAEVTLLQAERTAQTERLRLMQQIGVQVEGDVELTSSFEVFEPTWTVEELTQRAIARHPQLESARAAENASRAAARAATMQYLPNMRVQASFSGNVRQIGDDDYAFANTRRRMNNQFESCEAFNAISAGLPSRIEAIEDDCSQYVFTDEIGRQAVLANQAFPFDYNSSPMTVSFSINLPILDGLTRERQVQQARSAAADARHLRRAEELNRRTAVAAAHVALLTAYRTVAIEERNVAAAADALQLAQERYRLGAGSIVELTQAQTDKARADQAHLAALYSFHENLAGLEAAVGEPLH